MLDQEVLPLSPDPAAPGLLLLPEAVIVIFLVHFRLYYNIVNVVAEGFGGCLRGPHMPFQV